MDVEQFLDQPIIGHFINGEFEHPIDKEPLDFHSPYTDKVWKRYVPADVEDAIKALEAAQRALPSWKNLPNIQRGKFLRKIGELVHEYQNVFSEVMAYEIGKPISQGNGEVFYAKGYLNWYAGEAERIYGITIPSQHPNKRLQIQYEPVGVCGLITPWNFPLAIPVRKIAAALAAGCTAVIKPSSETPISMLLFAHICTMAGLPPGVLNVIPGDEKKIGKTLLTSPAVRKLSFTGSTEVGQYLYQRSGETVKKLTLELGGHAPLIVFDDADIEKAVEGTVQGKFRNNGQTCVCPNRIFLQEGIYDSYVAKFIERVKHLTIGDPLDPQSDLTKILHPSSQRKIVAHIEDAVEKGATLLLKGENPYEPTILTGITPNMLIFQEETFGPVAGLTKFHTTQEAIDLANATQYGLASYLFTSNLETAQKTADALEFGIVGINDGLPSSCEASFGGINYSGFGREGGPTGIYEYLVEKYISIA